MADKHLYEFVRIKNRHDNKEGKIWYFRAKTLSEVNLHTDQILRPLLQGGFNSFSEKFSTALSRYLNCKEKDIHIDFFMAHADNDVEAGIRNIDAIFHENPRPLSMFETTNQMLIDAYHARVETLQKFGECYLANGVAQYGFSKENDEICETILSEEFVYPTQRLATMDDVRIIQWPGGAHYYAKIGNFDVVHDGKQKWDSEIEAKKAAYWFIQFEKPYL
jgi:hypothetical protein